MTRTHSFDLSLIVGLLATMSEEDAAALFTRKELLRIKNTLEELSNSMSDDSSALEAAIDSLDTLNVGLALRHLVFPLVDRVNVLLAEQEEALDVMDDATAHIIGALNPFFYSRRRR